MEFLKADAVISENKLVSNIYIQYSAKFSGVFKTLQRFVSWKTSFHTGALKSDLSSAQVTHSKLSKDMERREHHELKNRVPTGSFVYSAYPFIGCIIVQPCDLVRVK